MIERAKQLDSLAAEEIKSVLGHELQPPLHGKHEHVTFSILCIHMQHREHFAQCLEYVHITIGCRDWPQLHFEVSMPAGWQTQYTLSSLIKSCHAGHSM